MTHKERLERRALMAELINFGHTVDYVARKFHVTDTTVIKACQEFEVKVSCRPYLDSNEPTLSMKILSLLYQRSKGVSDIEQELNVSRSLITQVYQSALKLNFPRFPKRKIDSKGLLSK